MNNVFPFNPKVAILTLMKKKHANNTKRNDIESKFAKETFLFKSN